MAPIRIKKLWELAQLFARRLASGQVSAVQINIPTRDHQRLLESIHKLSAATDVTIAAIGVRTAAEVRILLDPSLPPPASPLPSPWHVCARTPGPRLCAGMHYSLSPWQPIQLHL